MLSKSLSSILFFFSSISMFPRSREEQEATIDTVERRHASRSSFLRASLCQYDCHAKAFHPSYWIIANLMSLLIFPIVVPLLFFRASKKSLLNTEFRRIALTGKLPSIFDEKKYSFVHKPLGLLGEGDLKFVSRILFGSGFRPYFILRCIWKMGIYKELLTVHRPEEIVVSQEMTFESSLITHYLAEHGVAHVNVMHGEKFFSLRDAFSTFSRFYVWDDFYSDLFRSLRCGTNDYVVFNAVADLKIRDGIGKNVVYYAQGGRSKADMKEVAKNIATFAAAQGCHAVVRFHPRHRSGRDVGIFESRGVYVEPVGLSLAESLSGAKYVCSEFSSVLYQGAMLNKVIVVDNSNEQRFEILKTLSCIFIEKFPHTLLVRR